MAQSSAQGAPIDRYVVLRYLAEGGMGAIYLGKKLGAGGFEKEVVLKQLLPEFTKQPEFIDLFLREARLSASLDHANIIHTIDLVTAGDEHFMVMEYLDGADLRTLLKKAKRRKRLLSAKAGIVIAREILSALSYAHAKIGPHGKPLRLIHRDVSPSNILISRNGEVKLTDFGIAKASTHNSVLYRVKGKVGYMSPEQARSEPLDHRSDLYSLAVCIYEVITGERLFVHAGLTTSADDIYNQPIELLSKKVPGLPPELDKVMLRALAIDPNHRYQTASELQEALLRVAHRCGLMMSSPDLAAHLRECCGDPNAWRELDRADSGPSAGTELYDGIEGTQQIEASGLDEDGFDFDDDNDLISVIIGPDEMGKILDAGRNRRERAQTSLTHLSQLQRLELTSMINLADGDGGGEDVGAEPLVDLGALGGEVDAYADVDDTGDVLAPLDDSRDTGSFETPQPVLENELPEDELLDNVGEGEQADATGRQRSRWPLLIIAMILLAGIGVAAAIGLTGPELQAPSSSSAGPDPR